MEEEGERIEVDSFLTEFSTSFDLILDYNLTKSDLSFFAKEAPLARAFA
jgi:hypothetical protein